MRGEKIMTLQNIDMNAIETKQPKSLNPMKGLMSRFNNSNIFGIDTTGFKYVSLKELHDTDPDATHKVYGLFTNSKGKFGAEPNAIIENNLIVNMPRHLLDTVNELLDDDKYIEYIKQGHVGFKVYKYHSNKYNKDAYSVTWLDI